MAEHPMVGRTRLNESALIPKVNVWNWTAADSRADKAKGGATRAADHTAYVVEIIN